MTVMTGDEIEIDLDDLQRRMDGAHAVLRSEFAALRTGRASGAMLDTIQVSAYGTMMPLNQCATVNVPEPRMLTVNVWDKTLIGAVEKALRASSLGINPVVEGTLMRLPIPELNEERRRELTKVAGHYAEGARIAIRNVRRDGMDQIKKANAQGMSEDEQKLYHDEIQELTDEAIKKIDTVLALKQEEIMQV
jgi:ribosome recycling factor